MQIELRMSEWISVKDRLPDHGQKLICYGPPWGVNFALAFVDFDGKTVFANVRDGCFPNPEVTHWMPLPDPPKEIPEEYRHG